MNFDQLKEQWNKEGNDLQVPDTIKQLKESKHPVEKIKKNMKSEFPTQVFSVIMIGFFPLVLQFPASQYTIYYISYTFLVIVSCYYLFEFYKFYKQAELYTGNTRNSLWKIYHELTLNMERYQSFGFLLLPHLMITLGLTAYNTLGKKGESLTNISSTKQIVLILLVVVGIVAVVAGIVLWTKYFYGRSARQLEKILDEIEE
ncbi:hypothetical protein [Chryseobacterium sp. JK1]|uniref:hypothetical protein n=1 Tax=Chryseobacterium sp. JK1 TaxID=874294 RepID=UPI003D69DB01